MHTQRSRPYVWVTTVAKVMAGELDCEWSAWFRAHFTYDKLPAGFDEAKWRLAHTPMVRATVMEFRSYGYSVTTERQNSFKYHFDEIIVAGAPDIIAVKEGRGVVIDCKSGVQRATHPVQVMLYMAALAAARPEFADVRFEGIVRYKGGDVIVPGSAVNEEFHAQFREVVLMLGGTVPLLPAPSALACRFCDIAAAYCPSRIED